MTAQEFKQEVLNHYMDGEFQVTVDRDPTWRSTGNGLFHAALFYTILYQNNLIDDLDRDRFHKLLELCWKNEPSGKPIHGLLERHDGADFLEAHDDYHIVTPSFLLGTYHARAIADYGDMHFWSYNSNHPHRFSLQTWHARFIGHIAYLELAANKLPSSFQGTLLRFKIDLGPDDHPDGFMSDWLKVMVMLRCGEKYKKSALQWIDFVKEEHKSLGKMFERYFGKDHPFAKVPTIEGVFP